MIVMGDNYDVKYGCLAVDASDHVYIASTTFAGGGTDNNCIRMFILNVLPAAATTAPSASSISTSTRSPTAAPSSGGRTSESEYQSTSESVSESER